MIQVVIDTFRKRIRGLVLTLGLISSIVIVNLPRSNFDNADVLGDLPVKIVGTQTNLVELVPRSENTVSASLQVVEPKTSSAPLNEAVSDYINQTVTRFKSSLPQQKPVGFLWQLRIMPRLDFVSSHNLSLALETEEYAPNQPVKISFSSWQSVDGKLEQIDYSQSLASQLTKALNQKPNIIADAPANYAVTLLPNRKLRIYDNAPNNLPSGSIYTDIPVSRIKDVRTLADKFYADYPTIVDKKAQQSLNKQYKNFIDKRTINTPTNCALQSCVALTYDDGPDPNTTPKVLDILKSNSVKASFFVLGNRVQQFPEIVKQAASSGHEIENHSYSHADFVKLHNVTAVKKQISDTQNILHGLGIESKFLRPPYGSVDNSVRSAANMPIVMWNVDSQEWRHGRRAQDVADSLLSQVRPGAIILLHDTHEISAEVTQLLIENLKARDYRFVTVQQLLQIDANSRGEYYNKY